MTAKFTCSIMTAVLVLPPPTSSQSAAFSPLTCSAYKRLSPEMRSCRPVCHKVCILLLVSLPVPTLSTVCEPLFSSPPLSPHPLGAATKPLLRQLENLQAIHSTQAANWEMVEGSLTERLGESTTWHGGVELCNACSVVLFHCMPASLAPTLSSPRSLTPLPPTLTPLTPHSHPHFHPHSHPHSHPRPSLPHPPLTPTLTPHSHPLFSLPPSLSPSSHPHSSRHCPGPRQ